MKKIKFGIFYHSIVNIITNSSTELFCQIESDIIEDIQKFLHDELGISCSLYTYEEDDEDMNGKSVIQFEMDWGGEDNETTQDMIVKLLDKVLEDKFGKDNYFINKDVNY